MNRARAFVAASVVLAGIAASGVAFAQALVPPPATTPSPASSATTSPRPSATTRVETWTKKQWDAAKKEWAKDKAKWADCRKQSKAQKLSGRKSWSFLYQCMAG
jgi:cation diffusion facilitator CzcD-associated flavoprotein CzcO